LAELSDSSNSALEPTLASLNAQLASHSSPDEKSITLGIDSNQHKFLYHGVRSVWERKGFAGVTVNARDESSSLNCFAYLPTENMIVLPNVIEKTIDVFNLADRKWTESFASTLFPIRGLRFVSASNKLLFSSGASVRIWSLDTGREDLRLLNGAYFLDISSASKEGRVELRSISLRDRNSLTSLDSRSGRTTEIQIDQRNETLRLALEKPLFGFFLNGSRFVSADLYGNTVDMYDSASGQPLGKPIRVNLRAMKGFAVAENGSYLLALSIETSLDDEEGKLLDLTRCPDHTQCAELDLHWNRHFTQFAFSPDAKSLIASSQDGYVGIWSIPSLSYRETRVSPGDPVHINPIAISADGQHAYVASGSTAYDIRLSDFSATPVFTQAAVITGLDCLTDHDLLATGGSDGVVRLYSLSGKEKVALVGLDDLQQWDAAFGNPFRAHDVLTETGTARSRWVSFDDDGHFDTSNFDDTRDVHWLVPSVPLQPLPLETLMAPAFSPNLVARKLSNDDATSPDFAAMLNPSQPLVTLVSVSREPRETNSATVIVSVKSQTADERPSDGSVWGPSGMRDLRILRDGELVREVSLSTADAVKSSAGCSVESDDGTVLVKCTHVPLPSAFGGTAEASQVPGISRLTDVEFVAYAFSIHGIKSESAVYRIPRFASSGKKGKAYLIVFGANASAAPKLNLVYAAKDAGSFADEFSHELENTNQFSQVVQVRLVSDYKGKGKLERVTRRDATKGNLESVLSLLAGRDSGKLTHKLRCGAWVPFSCPTKLEKAGPDDIVIVYVAAHGDTDEEGRFFILPYDVKVNSVGDAIHESDISSQELASWFRDVDAGGISLILDTCYSKEAIASPGFKPGPFGSKSLGELAYAKGMRILAASQGFAFESGQVNHGLLNSALIEDGLISRRALYAGDSEMTLSQLFQYALKRVPETYRALYPDSISDFEQHPTFFDFGSRMNDLVFRLPSN
jgi:WD40 repeat protein